MARLRPPALTCCRCCYCPSGDDTPPERGSRQQCAFLYRVLLALLTVHTARTHTEAFIQSENVIEVLRFDEGGLLETETTIGLGSYQQKSVSLHRGNCRPIRFEPPMLDFHEQPVGMPKMEKVYLHNPSSEETITLVSISATTSHFHASFFQNRKILPGGNTSFDVVFLARVVGNVENTLFINTSNHGVFTYQVFGVGIPNPYRLRPFIGARVPVNSSFSPLINIHNPHSEPLQVVEMYSSGGDLHLELPTGQQGGTRKLWEIPPYETKGVMRASFSSREADNHTAFIRIKTNASDSAEFIILPVEVEVTTAPGIYSSTEMLDFGTLRTQDVPKVLNLHLLNSGTKDVPITSVRSAPQNDAITVHFKPITLKASENKYTKVASISFDASKAKKSSQLYGKITVKAKEKSYSKLEIPYQAEVLDGYLGFDYAATLFHIRDSPPDPVERAILLTNTFNFAVLMHDVLLPEDAKAMFKIQNFSSNVLILPGESRYIFSLLFTPSTSSVHIDSNILLITNASKFHLPVRAYTGFLEYFVLPLKQEERVIDFGILSAAESSSLLIAIINSNPIELVLKSWHIIGDSLAIELLSTEKGNKTSITASLPEIENSTVSDRTSVILTSGYYAVFRVTITAKDLEGSYDGGIQITTDYEILTIPVKALVAVGSLTCSPKQISLPPSFPGKTVHQSLNIMSSFSQKVKIQHIRSLSEDVRFFYKRLRSNKDELEPGKKSKIANIYFDAALNCGDHCYVGLPFLYKNEARSQHHLAMQEDAWDLDWDIYENLYKKWSEVRENAHHMPWAIFEVDTDLQKNVLSEVKTELVWPSIVSSSRHIRFPLTNTNSSSEEEIVLENPSDAPVYVQFLPLALYSNCSLVLERIKERFNISKSLNLDLKTLEFKVFSNNVHPVQSSQGFVEGPSRQSVLNLLLKPGEKKNLKVKFTPVLNESVSSLLIVRFTPDFTSSRVIRELKFVTTGGSEFVFILNASLPYHMLATCAEALPRPNWELALYVIISGIMSLLFLLVIATAYLEAQGIWEPFKRRLSIEASNPPFHLGRPFDLRRIVGISSESNLNSLGSDSSHSSNRGLYAGSNSKAGSGNHKPSNSAAQLHNSRSTPDVDIARTKTSSTTTSRISAHASVAQSSIKASSVAADSSTANPSQYLTRRARGTKLNQNAAVPQTQVLQEQLASTQLPAVPQPEPPADIPASRTVTCNPSHPEYFGTSSGNVRHSSDDSDITNLIEVMDKDFDNSEPASSEVFTEQPPSPAAKNKGKGKSLPQKAKLPRKQEEKERRGKGKLQEDDLKDSLADDDSSSTTTETSNPDTEHLVKEEPEKLKGKQTTPEKVENEMFKVKQKNKKLLVNNKKENVPEVKPSSLELPYTTPLENKQRKSFSKHSVQHSLVNGSKPRHVQKPRGTTNKLVDNRQSVLAKFLPSRTGQELGNTSSSEGEKDSPPPEWDCVPIHMSGSSADSLYKLSVQTLNADNFLKQRQTSPAPTSRSPPPTAGFVPRGSYSSVVNSTYNNDVRSNPSNTKHKLTKATSLPGRNGNPTFAAVAAGYDKNPGGSGLAKTSAAKSDNTNSIGVSHPTSLDSDGSDSSGLWSPLSSPNSPDYAALNSFSAFGSSNSFNLTGEVFSKFARHSYAPEPQKKWSEIEPASFWDSHAVDPVPTWPTSTGSPTHSTTSILGNTGSLWSTTNPFGSSIWSSNPNTSLPYATPATSLPGIDLMGSENTCPVSSSPTTAAPHSPDAMAAQTYDPWKIWSPTIGRRSSDPWPSSHYSSEN
ncbi:transmembrane 131 [Pelobates cultripes]|uniref:Transmembrane 131 n=1 Tax=Pelobates cultripes TaxID=61616 RepID=A0AAD1R3T4_PELCU|nr:transmembrane 131 [Pelobates cultripes]